MKIERSRKAGIASGLARQSPELIADKAQAIALHQSGLDTGAIARAIPPRQRTEIRRWLIAAGIYTTKGRGKANAGKRFYNAERLIATQYANDTKQIARMDDCAHWRRHPAVRQYNGLKAYYSDHEANKSRSLICARRQWQKNKSNPDWLAARYQHNQEWKVRVGYKWDAPQGYHSQYVKARKITDPSFKAIQNIRKRLKDFIKGKTGIRSSVLVGCNHAQFKANMASLFTEGMTWANYGAWHVDHKLPLSIFNLAKRKDKLTACHWSNLQPLWARDNLAKGDKTMKQVELLA